MVNVLVTGGAGYIGSHTVLELLVSGHAVTVVDNFSNSSPQALGRVESLSGRKVDFIEGDIRDAGVLARLFEGRAFDVVVHFAAKKAVAESVSKPLLYFENNVGATIGLLREMKRRGCKRFVFSSSATVYGTPAQLPLPETAELGPINPYGVSKHHVEQILQAAVAADPTWSVAILRYFNPAGAHPSGELGEAPSGVPSNLVPYVGLVASGQLPYVPVLGADYPTRDGTGVRDYIHVVDLARGHVSAVSRVLAQSGAEVFNLGTGRGYSVLEVVSHFEAASGRDLERRILPRRTGDVPACYADASKAKELLSWEAQYGMAEICRDAWRWQQSLAATEHSPTSSRTESRAFARA